VRGAGWSRADRGGTGQAGVGRPWSGRAEVGHGVTGVAPPWPVGGGGGEAVRASLGSGNGACGSNVRERSERKKGRGQVLYHLCSYG
jgi:hypothetical protein